MKSKLIVLRMGIAILLQYAGSLMDALFFYEWRRGIWDWLLNASIPTWIVTHFVAFLLLKLPDFILAGVLALGVGVSGWPKAKAFCLWVGMLYPIVDLVSLILFAEGMGLGLNFGFWALLCGWLPSFFSLPVMWLGYKSGVKGRARLLREAPADWRTKPNGQLSTMSLSNIYSSIIVAR